MPHDGCMAQNGWLDISVPIRPGMIVYEGDPPVEIERATSISGGDPSNVSRLNLGAHTGTHIDAPVHFIEGAAGVEEIDLEALMGPVTVLDATGLSGDIDRAAVQQIGLPADSRRLIFKTQNSGLWDLDHFSSDFIGLTGDAAEALVEHGVRLVGLDYLSVAPQSDPAPTHVELLGAGVVILEGLDLRAVAPGEYELVCLPLLIPGCDGSPARALLRRL
jgi:arylformamidase